MSRTFKVIVTSIFCVPLVLFGAAALIAGNPGTKTSAALMLLIAAIPLVLVAWWARSGHGGAATGKAEGRPEPHEFGRSLDMYDQDKERLDEPRDIYGGMTQRDMNGCCDSVRAFILDDGLKDRKPTSAREVQKLLKDFFRAGLHLADAQDALDDESADILSFFKDRRKAHKKATPTVLSTPLDAPEVISIFAIEMLNGKRAGQKYLEWRAFRASA